MRANGQAGGDGKAGRGRKTGEAPAVRGGGGPPAPRQGHGVSQAPRRGVTGLFSPSDLSCPRTGFITDCLPGRRGTPASPPARQECLAYRAAEDLITDRGQNRR